MASYITHFLKGGYSGGVQLNLAAVYESRIHTISGVSVPRAQYAADTSITLTDGSYNLRGTVTDPSVPKSATAFLANPSNTGGNFGKPMVIEIKRDSFTGEIEDYAVQNADGSWPGGFDPWSANARYKINTATGEIYVNNAAGLVEIFSPQNFPLEFYGQQNFTNPATDKFETITVGNEAAHEGKEMVVGMVEFDSLQGGALTAKQQQAAELSGAIQSLTSIIRSLNDNKRGSLNLIR